MDSRITQVLDSDIAKILKMAGFIFMIAAAFYAIQNKVSLLEQDVSYIKNNHLTHIEASLVENKNDIKVINQNINDLNVKLTRALTILEK